MTDASLPIDELLGRLRGRAADPERRTSSRPSQLTAELRTMDLGSMVSTLQSLSGQLQGLLSATQEGRIDPAAHATALDLERRMTTPAPGVLPAPADDATIAAFERHAGVVLPTALRRVYAEVADGGFGPGEGILPLAEVARQYAGLREDGTMPRGRTWPEGLLPLVSMDPGWDCVDAASGRVVAFDPEDLEERVSDRRWAAAFRDLHPSVEAWLTAWVGSRTQAEVMAAEREQLRSSGAYTHIRTLQAMSPEQLRGLGLEEGWEREMAATMGVPWPPPGEAADPPDA